ncbi:hypothetical protein Xbed_03127 [Xenorhabdus beddingii]|uniref:Uncharacterized protein n=1 Tax=Xenorhabdus beddingii TaxID=40578 RepID=A0A1Y2SIE7_9GAMM|nr:hypothetical protein [Xenorhabdus beddingii]OTA18591.1 hypothetical protein Xbed_03127 [Xenorhabdus beddingii]
MLETAHKNKINNDTHANKWRDQRMHNALQEYNISSEDYIVLSLHDTAWKKILSGEKKDEFFFILSSRSTRI